MKKITVLSLVMFLTFVCSYAQIAKGSKVLGIDFNINIDNNENDNASDYSSFGLTPNFKYFITDRLALGLGLGFSSSKYENTNSKNVTSIFGVSPELRYYFPTSSNQFYFFGQFRVGLGFGNNKFTQSGDTFESKLTTASVFLSPGVVYFPTPKWGIEFVFRGIGFSNTNPEGDNNNSSNFTLGINSFSPSLGLNYYF